MHYALVIVEKPSSAGAQMQGRWPAFVNDVSKAETAAANQYSKSENSWLIPLQSATVILATVVYFAQKWQLPYRVLYFAEQPIEYTYQPPST